MQAFTHHPSKDAVEMIARVVSHVRKLLEGKVLIEILLDVNQDTKQPLFVILKCIGSQCLTVRRQSSESKLGSLDRSCFVFSCAGLSDRF